MIHRYLLAALVLAVAGCGGGGNGGYYQDDGPGADAPSDAEIAALPDAVPRREVVFRPSLKPYRVGRKWYRPMPPGKSYREKGMASWYGRKFHGRKTANGERYDMYAMTAAHRTLPLPSYVRVTNRRNGRSVIVRVNDRGPFKKNRIIDLSYAAAKKLGIVATGTAPVIVELIQPGRWREAKKRAAPPAVQEREMPPSAGAGPVDSGRGVYVQTGVFSVWRNASGQKARLLLRGLQPVHLRHQQSDKGVLYRVLMGPYATEAQAREAVRRVKSSGIPGARVVSF